MESPHALLVNRTRPRGFTLLEMLVCIAIIGIITAIAVTGQSAFNQSTLLTDTAYTVALSLRQAQSLGLGSHEFSGVTNAGFGVHFASGAPGSYIIFADVNSTAPKPAYCPTSSVATTPDATIGNCLYDAPPANETYQSYSFSRGFTVSKFCGKSAGGLQCSNSSYYQSLDVLFLRPNTTAILTGMHSGTPEQLSCAEVHVASPDGSAERVIRVTNLGEVSVNETCP
jgi:prepilin-type N-terminal cleavage/methylation domain-containing protein